MILPGSSANSSSVSGLVGRYLRKVSAWAKFRVSRYGLAYGLLAIGALLLAIAVGVGTAALFDFIALRHGLWTAYGVVGGTYAGLAAVILIAGLVILKAKPPAMPAPPSPGRLLRHAVAPVAIQLLTTAERQRDLPAGRGNHLAVAGVAGLLLASWMASRRRSSLMRAGLDL